MPNFYGTFRQADHARKNMYVVIEAENFAIANAFMLETFGNDWSMLYDEENFFGQVEKF